MATIFPPFRSWQDVLTDARFSLPTLNDPERMGNRILHNLIYYQSNYFMLYLAIFLTVGMMYPKDMIFGAATLFIAYFAYDKISKARLGNQYTRSNIDNIIPIAVGIIVYLLIYTLGSVMVLLWGIVAPLIVIFIHATCRMRNLKNKMANAADDLLVKDPSPMTMLLQYLCIYKGARKQ